MLRSTIVRRKGCGYDPVSNVTTEGGMRRILHCMVACAAFAAAAPAAASALTVEECFEGSDFIANAARARENGISRHDFIARMEDDFELVHAYPPPLRWFAKDEEDERFLLDAARQVFEHPDSPEAHRARFLSACFARATA
jgi:hypothetical protein